MSGVRSIGGATLLFLVFLGVLAVLAQSAEEVPTELYVRTLPSGATIIVDGEQQGTSPRLFEVDPGEHTVTVKREGYQPKTKTVTIRAGRIRRVILELSKGAGAAAIDSPAPLAKPRQVRLLNADKSRQHGTPAVLDLASGELIAQPKTADDAAIAQYWEDLGRGDLAYPGEGLMVLRRGVVEQWNPTTRRFTPSKAIYQEPRGAAKPLATGYALENLPLRFRITTGDGKKFDVTVLEKKANGDYIEIEYRPLPKSAGPAQTGGKAPAAAAEPRNKTPEELAKTVVACLRQRDWMALVRFTVVSDDQWQSIEERIRRDLLDKTDANPSHMATRKGSHAEDVLQDWRRFVERGERDFDIDWTQAEYECAEYKIVISKDAKSQDIVATGKLNFVFSAGGKHYRASIDDVLLTDRGWLAADGPKWVGQLDGPVVSIPVGTEIVDQDVAQLAWGPAVEGVQCRLRTEKVKWDLREVKQPGRSLHFQVDFRNRSDAHRTVVPPTIHWHVEWDGESHGAEYTTEAPLWELPPGGELRDRPLGFPGNTFLDTKDQPTIGRHTVRVAFALKGTAAEVFSNPIEIEIVPARPAAEAEETIWGPAVEGVQMRVTEDKLTLAEGGKVDLRVDLRNRGNRDRRIALEHESWGLEIDGKWHSPSGGASGFRRELPLAAGQTQRDLEVWSWLWENLTATVQQLPPGKHTLRVARTLPGFGVPRGQSRIRVVSNPVEIEIVPEKPAGEKTSWGPADQGVQVRVGAARLQFEEGETPVLRADVRNRGTRDLFMWTITVNGWQIQVDGQWYRRYFRNTLLPQVLSAGGEFKNLELTFETRWRDKPVWVRTDDEKMALEWRPGKHTVRVALLAHHPQNVDLPSVRAESNPVEVEILPKKPAGKSTALPPPKLSTHKLFSASHGEDAGILAVAFSADGRTVAAVDQAAKVILRDARSGRQTVSFDLLTAKEREAIFNGARPHKVHSGAIAFSPEGEILAVAAGPMVKLYDAATGRFKRTLHDNSLLGRGDQRAQSLLLLDRAHGSVHCLDFSPDGRIIATGGSHWSEAPGPAPGCLKVWDAATGDLMHDVDEHFGEVRSVAFSPDGKELISVPTNPRGSRERGATFWNPLSGRYRSHTVLKSSEPWSVAYSPDGTRIAAGCSVARGADQPPEGFLLVWDSRSGASLVSRGIPRPVASVAFSADGKTLATGVHERGVTLRDAETLEPKGEIRLSTDPSGNIEGTVRVAFSPAGNLLAVGAEDQQRGFVTVWEVGQGEPPIEPPAQGQKVSQGEPPIEPPAQGQEIGQGEPPIEPPAQGQEIGQGEPPIEPPVQNE